MSRRVRCLFAAVAAIAMFGLFPVQPADAAVKAPCPHGAFCAYDGTNFTGTRWVYGGFYGGCWNVIPSANDRWSSAVNFTYYHVRIYEDANCGGTNVTLDNSIYFHYFKDLNSRACACGYLDGKFGNDASSLRMW